MEDLEKAFLTRNSQEKHLIPGLKMTSLFDEEVQTCPAIPAEEERPVEQIKAEEEPIQPELEPAVEDGELFEDLN